MKKNIKFFSIIAMVMVIVSISAPVLAAYGLEETATNAGLSTETSIPKIVGSIIGVMLSLLGVIFLVLMIYGGTLWMTSYGNTQKVEKAKNLIIDGVIGLVIVLAAYAITNFVIGALVGTQTTPAP